MRLISRVNSSNVIIVIKMMIDVCVCVCMQQIIKLDDLTKEYFRTKIKES